MTITYDEFLEQLAALYAFGLPQKDEWELVYWHKAIKAKELTAAQVGAAVLKITQDETKFWDTDNVPAMIIKAVKEIAEDKKITAFKNQILLTENREEAEDKKALASWGGTPGEAEANRQKTRELIRGVFK